MESDLVVRRLCVALFLYKRNEMHKPDGPRGRIVEFIYYNARVS